MHEWGHLIPGNTPDGPKWTARSVGSRGVLGEGGVKIVHCYDDGTSIFDKETLTSCRTRIVEEQLALQF